MPEQTLKPGWTMVNFGDVVRQVKDKVDPHDSGLERYIAGEHMDTDDLRIRRWGEINHDYLGPAFHMRFKPGQVLYGSRRTYLRKVAAPDFEGICANTTFVLEPKDPEVLLPELLPFIMQTESFHDHSIKQSKGSVNPYVNFSDLAWYEFALPPLAEQRRLAEVLWAQFDLVEHYHHVVHLAIKLRESIREYIFDPVRTYTTPLGDAIEVIVAGKSPVGINEPPLANQYAVLKVSAVGVNGFRPLESKTLVDQNEFLPECSVKTNDLLVTRANTPDLVGMACLVANDYPNLMLSDKTLRLVPCKSISARLLYEALWTRSVRQQIKSLATGTGAAMKNISQEKLQKLQIQLPADSGEDSIQLNQLVEVSRFIDILMKRIEHTCDLMKLFINKSV